MAPTAFLAAPPAVPPVRPPVIDPWGPVEMTWTGWNGSSWRVSDFRGGVLLGRAVRGLGAPKATPHVDSSPAVHGQRYRGHVLEPRRVRWNVSIFTDDSSQAWVDLSTEFWRTMDYDQPGTWTVRHSSIGTRHLRCRFVDDEEHAYNHDPVLFGWAAYGINMVADQPYWEGDPLVASWGSSTPQDFIPTIGGVRKGPPFNIAEGSRMGNATLTNPGDVDSYVTWKPVGPFDSAIMGLGGRRIIVPFAVEEGKALVIDPRPANQTVYEATVTQVAGGREIITPTGVERTRDVIVADWEGSRVPPGDTPVELDLEMVGAGHISAELTPLFRRGLTAAYGGAR